MRVIESLEALPLPGARPVVATCGNFDGVHLGHRSIMERVTQRARAIDATSTVVTFDPHPLRILAPERAPRLLTTRTQKLAHLERLGIELVALLPFGRALADMSPEVFVETILVTKLRAVEVYVGPDFRFGRGRIGDVPLMKRIGTRFGMEAAEVPPLLESGERISASRIRNLLSEGAVRRAAALLGSPFALAGTIVHGEGRGKTQLVPTANLAPENEFLPARGVYVTETTDGNRTIPGLTNVGNRPTFGDRRLVVETHLPGLDENLYGHRIELAFLERIRDERRFETPQQLRAQIAQDIAYFEEWTRRRTSE